MNTPPIITTLTTDDEIRQLLALQQKNLARNNSPETVESQGFVTVEHTFDLLKQMSQAAPQTIAKDGDTVAGYALVMLPEFRPFIPTLEPMFALFGEIPYKGRLLSEYNYYVMGQICVGEGYRGQGIFDKMYQYQRATLASQFDLCITDVATRNQRSMKAHARVGFENVREFTNAPDDTWAIVVWDFRE